MGHLDQELITHGAKEPFNFAAALGASGAAVHEAAAEDRQRTQQLLRHEARSVVEVGDTGNAVAEDPPAKRRLGGQGVLDMGPAVTGDEAAVVVEEAEQDRLLPADHRAVERVADPQLVRAGRLKSPEGDVLAAQCRTGEPAGGEVALERARVRRPLVARAEHLGDVGGGACGILAAQVTGEGEQSSGGARFDPARGRHERPEAA